MSDRVRKLFGVLWLLLGLAGVALVAEGAIRARVMLQTHPISGVILLLVAVGAILGGLGLLRHWSRARMVLRTAAVIVILYCLLFQVMVGLELGWTWSAATIALILFGAATLWKLHHTPHRR